MKNKNQYKITNEQGKSVIVDNIQRFAKDVGVYYGQFYNALKEDGYTKKGGFKIERVTNTTENKTPPVQKKPLLEVINVHYEGNTQKIEFKTPQGVTHKRKVTLKRVDSMYGLRCHFSDVNIPKGELYAACNLGQGLHVFSVTELKKLGMGVNIDFDFNTKIVEKQVEVFTPERLEEVWLEKMDKVTKEITAVQKKLSQLKEAKEYIGQSLSQTKAMNERLSVADKYLSKLL